MKKKKKAHRHSAKIDAWNDFRRSMKEDRQRQEAAVGAPGRAFRGRQRLDVIDKTAADMGCWRSTPFEHEGNAVHGIRAGLCLSGESWRTANAEALAIVSEALKRMGAVRPSWDEAQSYHTMSPDQCAWCHGPIPDELDVGEHSTRYCSGMCARSAIQHRDFQTRTSADASYRAAVSVVIRSKAAPLECRECGRTFRPTQPDAKFCTPACSQAASSKALRRLPDASCCTCGTVFRPERGAQKFCSPPCKYKAVSTFAARRLCACCGIEYTARGAKSQYCSHDCAHLVSRMRKAERAPRRITPLVFDFLAFQAFRSRARPTDALFAEAA